MTDPVILFITAENIDQARAIGMALLEERIVACVNLVPGIESHYWWGGNIESASETLIIAKTVSAQVEKARGIVRRIHTYETFELVVVPIIGGDSAYLNWIDAEAGLDRDQALFEDGS